MSGGAPEEQPHFRRRFVVRPRSQAVTAAVEDDYHCMAVTLHHDGQTIRGVEAVMDRWPWTTCPGARDVLASTFTDVALAEAAARGSKTANCTHLYDLALLAAAHAHGGAPLAYDAYVSEPGEAGSVARLRRDGAVVIDWTIVNGRIAAPEDVAGLGLLELRAWIATLDPAGREAARLLQWAAIMANGRVTPMAEQSEARLLPANCYTLQPPRAEQARRIGTVYDFSKARNAPLEHLEGEAFRVREQPLPVVWPPVT